MTTATATPTKARPAAPPMPRKNNPSIELGDGSHIETMEITPDFAQELLLALAEASDGTLDSQRLVSLSAALEEVLVVERRTGEGHRVVQGPWPFTKDLTKA